MFSFYMEADKTVSQELEVSMLTTVLQTLTVPMPVCRYEILQGGPNGTAVRFVLVGDQVYHKWTCDSDTADTFCMVVYDCFVDDGEGDKIQLLNQDGCAEDKHLLNNLEYPTDLMAGQEAHVFKYADKSNIYFNCQIKITIKEPGQECARPTCAEAPRRRRRGARAPARKRREESATDLIVDVSYKNEILVGDVDLTENDIPASLRQSLNRVTPRSSSTIEVASGSSRGYCMSAAGFGVFMSFAAVFTIGAIFMTVMLCMNKPKSVQ
uniref:ZP domain-containing protein n=1 Tax=Plectus sambesii TaxID=2011161 RepID=A0A914URN5_9BILA